MQYYLTELAQRTNDYTINPTSAFVIEEPSAKKINLSELLLQDYFTQYRYSDSTGR